MRLRNVFSSETLFIETVKYSIYFKPTSSNDNDNDVIHQKAIRATAEEQTLYIYVDVWLSY